MQAARCYRLFGVALAAMIAFPIQIAFAADGDFTQLSLQELMSIEVVSASRRAEELSDIAAAVYVVTAEDIAASSATTLPELLATVPGLHVAQINAKSWAVSARDFNGRFANKLLVMIDGRTIYTPLFSGVFWERQDIMLEDIDRIEVIRGPGASVWGANAVNGIINIITKSPSETKGTRVSVRVGTEERIASLRQGGALDEKFDYRVYAKWREHGGYNVLPGVSANDDWWSVTTGFRVDSREMDADGLSFEGGLFFAGYDDTFTVPTFAPPFTSHSTTHTDASDVHLTGAWSHNFSSKSALETRAYYNYSRFDDVRLGEERHTFNLDAQHTFSLSPTNTLVWGGALRYSWDELTNGVSISMTDLKETTSLYSAFAQLTSELFDYRLIVTAGTKLEYDDYTGFELQPTFRALYRLDENHKIWGAISRAVRTPSRAEDGIVVNAAVMPGTTAPPTPPTEIRVYGSTGLDAESLVAIEGGYRGQIMDDLTFDFAGFHHHYEDLIYSVNGTPFFEAAPILHAVAPQYLANSGSANAWGIEAAINWQPSANLRFEFTYSYVDASISSPTGSDPQSSPYHQAAARILYQLTDRLDLNVIGRYVGLTPASGLGDYVDLDVNLRWKLNQNVDISLIGRNLVAGERKEYEPEFVFAGVASMSRPNASIALHWQN